MIIAIIKHNWNAAGHATLIPPFSKQMRLSRRMPSDAKTITNVLVVVFIVANILLRQKYGRHAAGAPPREHMLIEQNVKGETTITAVRGDKNDDSELNLRLSLGHSEIHYGSSTRRG